MHNGCDIVVRTSGSCDMVPTGEVIVKPDGKKEPVMEIRNDTRQAEILFGGGKIGARNGETMPRAKFDELTVGLSVLHNPTTQLGGNMGSMRLR